MHKISNINGGGVYSDIKIHFVMRKSFLLKSYLNFLLRKLLKVTLQRIYDQKVLN